MILFPFAFAAGSLFALLRGGNFEALSSVRLRFGGVLIGSALIVLLADLTGLPGAVGFMLVGLIVFIIALAQNVHLAGAITLGIGLALNLLVLVVNAHIPVRFKALVDAGEAAPTVDPNSLDLGAVRQLETAETNLAFLGDIVPVAVLNTVVSFGDLIAAAGLIIIAFRILSRRVGVVDLDELFGEPEIDLREPQVRRTQDRRQNAPRPPVSVSGQRGSGRHSSAASQRSSERGTAPGRRIVRQSPESLSTPPSALPKQRASYDQSNNGVGNIRPRR